MCGCAPSGGVGGGRPGPPPKAPPPPPPPPPPDGGTGIRIEMGKHPETLPLLPFFDDHTASCASESMHYFVEFSNPSVPAGTAPEYSVEVAHLLHLEDLRANGTLLSCGIYDSLDSGFMILRGKNKADIEKIISKDPIIIHGYYRQYTIRGLIPPNCTERNELAWAKRTDEEPSQKRTRYESKIFKQPQENNKNNDSSAVGVAHSSSSVHTKKK
ncbi:MAG TPA: hypothetical protein VHD33_05975 [Legionellaceae bacterium]|nr:hypothetical protein [Legionellaceae bacterium]